MRVQKNFSEIYRTIITEINSFIISAIDTTSSSGLFESIVENIVQPYNRLRYDCIPLIVDNDEEYPQILANISVQYLNRYRHLFSKCNSELEYINLKFAKEGGEDNTINNTKENTGGSNGMSENAPINADITSIVSPNTKAQTETHATQTDNGTNNKSYNENNPYYFDTYLSIIKRYNLTNIIDASIQKILVEYSTII